MLVQVTDRVALLGEAADALNPSLAQDRNMTLQDVVCGAKVVESSAPLAPKVIMRSLWVCFNSRSDFTPLITTLLFAEARTTRLFLKCQMTLGNCSG